MKKRKAKKLQLARETVRDLQTLDAQKVAAGDEAFSCESGDCPCMDTTRTQLCGTQ